MIIAKLDKILEENWILNSETLRPKKETLGNDVNQGDLFNDRFFSEPEHTGDQSDKDEIIVTKVVRGKKRKGLKDQQLACLPTVDHIYEIESCTCPTCQAAMKEVTTIKEKTHED